MRSVEVHQEGAEVTIVLVADGFLRHMVRNIVGTLVDVGLGHRPPGSTLAALSARDRRAAGPTAPAHGLWLEEVFYPPELKREATTR
jgi:tRNA pseudouridine38-40 synthase